MFDIRAATKDILRQFGISIRKSRGSMFYVYDVAVAKNERLFLQFCDDCLEIHYIAKSKKSSVPIIVTNHPPKIVKHGGHYNMCYSYKFADPKFPHNAILTIRQIKNSDYDG